MKNYPVMWDYFIYHCFCFGSLLNNQDSLESIRVFFFRGSVGLAWEFPPPGWFFLRKMVMSRDWHPGKTYYIYTKHISEFFRFFWVFEACHVLFGSCGALQQNWTPRLCNEYPDVFWTGWCIYSDEQTGSKILKKATFPNDEPNGRNLGGFENWAVWKISTTPFQIFLLPKYAIPLLPARFGSQLEATHGRIKISPKKMALCKVSGGRSTSVDELQNLAFQDIFSRKICLFFKGVLTTWFSSDAFLLKTIFNQHIQNTDLEHTTHPPAKTKRSLHIIPTPKTPKSFFFNDSELNNLFSCHCIYSKSFLIHEGHEILAKPPAFWQRRCLDRLDHVASVAASLELRCVGTDGHLCGVGMWTISSVRAFKEWRSIGTHQGDTWSLFRQIGRNPSFDQGCFWWDIFLSFIWKMAFVVGVLNDVGGVMLVVCLLMIGGPLVWEEEDLGWRYQTSNYSSWRWVCHKLAVRWAHVAWDDVCFGAIFESSLVSISGKDVS